MRLIKWGLGGLGLMVVSGAMAFSVVSFTGVASAQEPPGSNGPRMRSAEMLAEKLGIGVDELRSDPKAARDKVIDQAVANGRLTAEQATQLKTRELGAARGGMLRDGVRNVISNVFDAAAKVIGIDKEDIRTGLQDGKSLAQIAEANDVTRDELASGLSSELRANIQTALSEGKITQEQATRMLDNLDDRVEQIIDRGGKGEMRERMQRSGAPDGSRIRPFGNGMPGPK